MIKGGGASAIIAHPLSPTSHVRCFYIFVKYNELSMETKLCVDRPEL